MQASVKQSLCSLKAHPWLLFVYAVIVTVLVTITYPQLVQLLLLQLAKRFVRSHSNPERGDASMPTLVKTKMSSLPVALVELSRYSLCSCTWHYWSTGYALHSTLIDSTLSHNLHKCKELPGANPIMFCYIMIIVQDSATLRQCPNFCRNRRASRPSTPDVSTATGTK